jgi:hypothetical protein
MILQPKGASLVAGLRIGALVENLDIHDLTGALSRTDNSDIKLVYENLYRGSENHIRAFTRQLSSHNETYVPIYISPEKYQQTITTERETGNHENNKRNHGFSNE